MFDISMKNGSGEVQYRQMQGIAAEDLKRGEVELQVIVSSITPNASGKLEAVSEKATVEFTNVNGKTSYANVVTSNTITARYQGLSNFPYPPMVRKGEQLLITQIGDSDVYYWQSEGRDREIRTTDVLRMEVGAAPSFSEKTDKNTYFLELNSIDQTFTIKTSKDNGERFIYEIKIDSKSNRVTICDDVGNVIMLDSLNTVISLVNGLSSTVVLDKENVVLGAPQDLVIKAGRQVVLDTPLLTTSNVSGSGIFKMSANSIALDAANGVQITSNTFGVEGNSKFNGPVITGPMQSEGYCTNSVGSAYAASDIDVSKGEGSLADPAPESVDVPNSGGRHATAWEQLVELNEAYMTFFDEISAQIGVPSGHRSITAEIINRAKMNLMKGT